MKVKNTLKQQLETLGIKSMVPTEELLTKRLGGMTSRRFNKILANSSKKELTITEANDITRWLAFITAKPEAAIQLVETLSEEEAVEHVS